MLQFHVTSLFGLRYRCHGIAVPANTGLKLVFRDAELPADLFDDETQTILLPWDILRNIEAKKGWWGHQVTLAVNAIERLKGAPGLLENQIELKVHRTHVDQIDAFLRSVKTYRSGSVDETVDEFVDDVRDFLRDY